MLKWVAKKFFWSMAASAGFMVVMQMTPMRDKMNTEMLKQLRGIKNGAHSAMANHTPDSVKRMMASQGENPTGIVTTAELENTLGAVQEISSSSNEYVIDNEQYVLIQGKYYKARPDNTYMVNGEKVFYVSNRSERGKKAPEEKEVLTAEAEPSMEMPTNPLQMMETLKQAQENMKKRNKMMKELEKDL